jgi:Uma2 family endonuclease
MSLAQFLAWEERQELRFEFDGFQPMAMTGGTVADDRLTFNLRRVLADRLAGKPCRPFGPSVKIVVDGRVRYPDCVAVCGPLSPRATVADNPVVVFEILSDSSQSTDLIEKNREYQATESIQRYVVIAQTSATAITFTGRGPDWLTEIIKGYDVVLHLPEIGIDLPLAALYANIEFEPEADAPEAAPA